MPSVDCPLCGSSWIAPAPVAGPDARCVQCAKPIKLVSCDFVTRPAEPTPQSASTGLEVARTEAQAVDEEARKWIRESNTGVGGVIATMVALPLFVIWYVDKLLIHGLRLTILQSLTVAWLVIGGLLIYWYRRSQAGDFEPTRAALQRRIFADQEQAEATATPKILIGTGASVAVATSAFGRGLRFSGADDSSAMILAVLILCAAALAIMVGSVWLLKFRFKYLRVAGFFRIYLMISFLAAFIGVMNLAGFR